MTDDELMLAAIEAARRGIGAGQTPFGCAVRLADGRVIAEHNRVWMTIDITAHAEVVALRAACAAAGQIHLIGATVATTCEPCPMCMAALHWARVERVLYGATIAEAAQAGFNEMPIAAQEMTRLGRSGVALEPGLRRTECAGLFDEWKRRGARAY